MCYLSPGRGGKPSSWHGKASSFYWLLWPLSFNGKETVRKRRIFKALRTFQKYLLYHGKKPSFCLHQVYGVRNLYPLQFTLFRYIVLWVLTKLCSCMATTAVRTQAVFRAPHCSHFSLWSVSSSLPFIFPEIPICLCPCGVAFYRMSSKWNRTAEFIFFQRNTLGSHLSYWVHWWLVHFYCWLIFHCMDVPPFIHLHLYFFQLRAITDKAAIIIWVDMCFHFSWVNTEVWHCGIIVKVTQSCLTLGHPMAYTVHGILQASILEWAAYPFSRGSSRPGNWTGVSCIAGGLFTAELSGKLLGSCGKYICLTL